jgi:hypothetical protein
VPVARSDPRRATVIGIVGVIVGTLLIVLVLVAGNLGDDSGKTLNSTSRFNVGPAKDMASTIERDQTPLIFQDPVEFQQPIIVNHLGDTPESGWTAFSAVAEGTSDCSLTWHKESQDFTDCKGNRIGADGGAQHHYPTTVNSDGDVIVDLSIDASSGATSS